MKDVIVCRHLWTSLTMGSSGTENMREASLETEPNPVKNCMTSLSPHRVVVGKIISISKKRVTFVDSESPTQLIL